MKTCTFFGHRDTPYNIKPIVTAKIDELISAKGVKRFYVGTQGNFDLYVIDTLIDISRSNPEIEIRIVLPKIPDKLPDWIPEDYTIVPEEAEKAPPRFAVDRCNRWMLEKSDYVVCYVTRSYGGAAKFSRIAEKTGKVIINLAKT